MNFEIGEKIVGDGRPVFFVAEIGINHNGSVETAKKLIDLAVRCGADAVKFQKRTIELIYTQKELETPRESVFGKTNGDLKRGLEFGEKQYREIDEYCRRSRILWFASCWDEESVDFIDRFDPPCYKIASASLTDDHLLRYTRSKNKPIILSTGMSTIEQIDHAVEVLGTDRLAILHCVATYPSEDHELNLLVIKSFGERFPGVPIGYSGHEKSGVAASIMAVVLGACILERHITLDRTMWGSDQAASLEPRGLELLMRDIRKWEVFRGDGVKRVYDSELPIIKKLRRK